MPALGSRGRREPAGSPSAASAVGGGAAFAVPGVEEEEEGQWKDYGQDANDDGYAWAEWRDGGGATGGEGARGGASVGVFVGKEEAREEAQFAVAVDQHVRLP